MLRSTAFDAAVVGLLAALVSFCGLQAAGEEPYSVVAQSTPATAGQGRRPISQRIASGRLPCKPVVTVAPEAHPLHDAPQAADADRDAILQRVREVLSATAVSEPPPVTTERIASAPISGSTGGLPARLEFDVRESRVFLTEGERVIVNIAVRNVGPTPARQVETALFFADGIEPVKTTGHGAAIAAGAVRLEPIASLEPGDSVILAVTAVGLRPGNVVYRGELACAELPGVLAREGSLQIEPRADGVVTAPAESD